MKEAKGEMGSNSMDRISELPKEILQWILYWLSQEEAVRTSVLSKSWRYIWSTHPSLRISDTMFKGNKKDFISVVDNSLQRYSDQRLSLEEFHLCIAVLDHESISLLEKWIPLLTNIGDFHLYIPLELSAGIPDLPSVVLKAKSLKLLSLHHCNLGQTIPDNISFGRLEEFDLYKVFIKNEIFDKIISSCPLLTTMCIRYCKGLNSIKLEKKLHRYLKHFGFIDARRDKCNIEIDVPSLETIKIYGCKIRFPSHAKFSNLKILALKWVVGISSNSMEQSQLCIDAPDIEYFTYSGSPIPSISVAPTLRPSKLDLYIHQDDVVDALSWFLRLSRLLQGLRQSGFRLNISHHYLGNMHVPQDILVQDIINGGNKPVVMDDMRLSFAYVPSLVSFLNGLFCICRPRNITPKWFSRGVQDKERELKELGKFFSNIQQMRENGNQEIWQDLEDFSVGGFDESLQQWQPLQVTTLSECALPNFDRFRVQLQWSDLDCECSP